MHIRIILSILVNDIQLIINLIINKIKYFHQKHSVFMVTKNLQRIITIIVLIVLLGVFMGFTVQSVSAQCSSLTFSKTSPTKTLGSDFGEIKFSFTDFVTNVSGPATVTFYVRGDLDFGTGENYDFLDENGNTLGSTTGSSCGSYLSVSVTVSRTTLLKWMADGSIDFVSDARNGVHVGTCAPNESYVELSYPYKVCPKDMALLSIDTPDASCQLSSDQKVSIRVANVGLDSIDTLQVAYQVDGGPVVNETWVEQFPPFDTLTKTATEKTYTFSKKADMSGDKLYTVNAWVMANEDTLHLNDTINDHSANLMGGTYQIGGSNKDFGSFTAAYEQLRKAGICDTVIFEVVDSVFKEQLTLQPVKGAAANAPIIFRSKSGDPRSTVLFYDDNGFSDNYTIQFNGGRYYQFRDITIANTSSGLYTSVLNFEGNARNNVIAHSILQGDLDARTTSTDKAVVFADDVPIADNKFMNNTIKGGSYGVYLYGDYSQYILNTSVIGNHFQSQYTSGVYFFYHENVRLNRNVYETNIGPDAFDRFYFEDIYGVLEVNGNHLKSDTMAGNGFLFRDVEGKSFVVNNFIHAGDSDDVEVSNGIKLGFDNFDMLIAHNSFYIESQNSSSRAIWDDDGFDNNLTIVNNNIYNDGPGYGIYDDGGIAESNSNNIYVPNGNVGYSGGDQSTLTNWQSATGFDNNGMSVSPGYYSPDDLHTCQDSLDQAAQLVDTVMQDIDGEPRGKNSDIGADEFYTPSSFSLGEDRKKCPSESITIGRNLQQGTFRWSHGDTTAQSIVNNPGMYTFSYITLCDTMQDSIRVQNYKAPRAQFVTDTSHLTIYVENRAENANNFYWDFGDGFTTNKKDPYLHIYESPGFYPVRLIAKGPCMSDTIKKTVAVDTSVQTGIKEREKLASFKIYPNPVEGGQITVAFDQSVAEKGQVELQVVNVRGKQVFAKNIRVKGRRQYRINDIELSPGMYFFKVRSESKQWERKFVVSE